MALYPPSSFRGKLWKTHTPTRKSWRIWVLLPRPWSRSTRTCKKNRKRQLNIGFVKSILCFSHKFACYSTRLVTSLIVRDLDKIDDLMQDITEQQEVAQEISEAISRPFGDTFDEVSFILLCMYLPFILLKLRFWHMFGTLHVVTR